MRGWCPIELPDLKSTSDEAKTKQSESDCAKFVGGLLGQIGRNSALELEIAGTEEGFRSEQHRDIDTLKQTVGVLGRKEKYFARHRTMRFILSRTPQTLTLAIARDMRVPIDSLMVNEQKLRNIYTDFPTVAHFLSPRELAQAIVELQAMRDFLNRQLAGGYSDDFKDEIRAQVDVITTMLNEDFADAANRMVKNGYKDPTEEINRKIAEVVGSVRAEAKVEQKLEIAEDVVMGGGAVDARIMPLPRTKVEELTEAVVAGDRTVGNVILGCSLAATADVSARARQKWFSEFSAKEASEREDVVGRSSVATTTYRGLVGIADPLADVRIVSPETATAVARASLGDARVLLKFAEDIINYHWRNRQSSFSRSDRVGVYAKSGMFKLDATTDAWVVDPRLFVRDFSVVSRFLIGLVDELNASKGKAGTASDLAMLISRAVVAFSQFHQTNIQSQLDEIRRQNAEIEKEAGEVLRNIQRAQTAAALAGAELGVASTQVDALERLNAQMRTVDRGLLESLGRQGDLFAGADGTLADSSKFLAEHTDTITRLQGEIAGLTKGLDEASAELEQYRGQWARAQAKIQEIYASNQAAIEGLEKNIQQNAKTSENIEARLRAVPLTLEEARALSEQIKATLESIRNQEGVLKHLHTSAFGLSDLAAGDSVRSFDAVYERTNKTLSDLKQSLNRLDTDIVKTLAEQAAKQKEQAQKLEEQLKAVEHECEEQRGLADTREFLLNHEKEALEKTEASLHAAKGQLTESQGALEGARAHSEKLLEETKTQGEAIIKLQAQLREQELAQKAQELREARNTASLGDARYVNDDSAVLIFRKSKERTQEGITVFAALRALDGLCAKASKDPGASKKMEGALKILAEYVGASDEPRKSSKRAELLSALSKHRDEGIVGTVQKAFGMETASKKVFDKTTKERQSWMRPAIVEVATGPKAEIAD